VSQINRRSFLALLSAPLLAPFVKLFKTQKPKYGFVEIPFGSGDWYEIVSPIMKDGWTQITPWEYSDPLDVQLSFLHRTIEP
jgi:hypothetical protein